MMKKGLLLFLLLAASHGPAQSTSPLRFYSNTSSYANHNSFARHLLKPVTPHAFRELQTTPDSGKTTSLWIEMGYILAIESALGGLSYLASLKSRWGRYTTGGFDLMMGVAGILGSQDPANSDSFAYYLLISGFFVKAIYNFLPPDSYSPRDRFWTNLIGLNILIFSGYYLDSLI